MVRRAAWVIPLLAATMTGCALTAKLDAAPPTPLSPTPVSPSPSPTPSPTPTATPRTVVVKLPTRLPNGWVRNAKMDKVTAGIVAYFNQENPDAKLVGGTYFPPKTANPTSGAMLVVLGPGDVDEVEMLQLLDGETTAAQGDVVCARGAKAADRIFVCVTRQAPTVIARSSDTRAYDERKLARFVADYQATLLRGR